MIKIEDIEKEYSTIFPKCEGLCTEIYRQLQHLIDREQLQLAVPIQFRAKTILSIIDKLNQGRYKIKKSVLELQDLSGLRIITLFKRDALKIIDLIESQFEIVKNYNPEDKLNESEFGYSSIHIICKLKDKWLEIPTFSEFSNLTFEIQVRTLSQHSWAEVSNIFQYKNKDNVPKPLKRSISRISALLETIDLEFERLLVDRDSYKVEIKSNKETLPKQNLNVDLLEEILNQKIPKQHKYNDEDYSELLDELNKLGYANSQAIIKIIDENLDFVLAENKRICEGFKTLYQKNPSIRQFENFGIFYNDIKRVLEGTFFSQTGLVREMLTKLLGKPYYKALEEINKNRG